MAHVVLSASEVLVFMVSLYGWGSLVNLWCGGSSHTGWAYPSALGIAVLIAVGGILNAIGVAKPIVLLSLLAIGIGLAGFFVFHIYQGMRKHRNVNGRQRKKLLWNSTGNLVYLAFILLIFFFLVVVLMPAWVFNFHDDFHAYLMWPIRMLQTGSLGGNPFDHLGVSSLGSQSFMQGIFLTFGNMASVNVFDAIICLILVLGLLKELGDLIEINPLFTIAAGLLAVIINPHYVNLSSLYSGSLMLLGLTYTTIIIVKPSRSRANTDLFLAAVPCALFFAALLTLKTTYIIVVLSFWGGCFFFSLLLTKERKPVLFYYLFCAVITTLFLLPWISLYWDRYLQKIYYIFNDISYAQGITTHPPVPEDNVTTLLSNKEMSYGNTYLDYLGIVVMLFFAFVAASWIAWKKRNQQEVFLLISFLAVFLSAVFNYFGLQFLFGPARMVVRYSCPVLIAASPVGVLIAGWFWAQGNNPLQTGPVIKKASLLFSVILILSQLGVIWSFQETFMTRVQKAYSHRTLFSSYLAEDLKYRLYNDYVLSDEARDRMMNIQKSIPVGETIFAWAAMPMHFNFTRNLIYMINDSGLAYNLRVMPLSEGTERMKKYFREFGIRYIIWDNNFYGMKTPAQMGNLQSSLVDILNGLISKSKVLYKDDITIVFDIGPGK